MKYSIIIIAALIAFSSFGAIAKTPDICMDRQYTDKHMASHPNQLVTRLSGRVWIHQENPSTYIYMANVVASKRGGVTGQALLMCEQDKKQDAILHCSIPDSYGGGSITFIIKNNHEITMHLEKDFVLRDREMEPIGHLSPGLDDRVFRLSAWECEE